MPFETFSVLGVDIDTTAGRVYCHFSFDDTVRFTETLDFGGLGADALGRMRHEGFASIMAHVAIAIGVSYYKLSPTPRILVRHCTLDPAECAFWGGFYRHGLGEYLYRNKIDPAGLFHVESSGVPLAPVHDWGESSRALIPIGGGKDSCVSVELWRATGIPFDTFTFGRDYTLHRAVADVIGGRHVIVPRTLDPELLRMNASGKYYNGHVPITGIIAFVLLGVAYLGGYHHLVLSNERSANEGNTLWHGASVNHQYSKSLDFERDFKEYTSRGVFAGNPTRYFSLLRGLYEIDIARRFALYPEYFPVFSSCNANFKVIESSHSVRDRWCRHCPKCAFVYAMIRPFVSTVDAEVIFGADLFEDTTLMPVYRELLGVEGIKPFECVGTPEEVRLALTLACRRYADEGRELPPILRMYHADPSTTLSDIDTEILSKHLFAGDGETCIPEDVARMVF